jgi:hypothetical protein
MFWGVLGVIAILITSVIGFQQFRPTYDSNKALSLSNQSELVDTLPQLAKEAIDATCTTESTKPTPPVPVNPVVEDDGRMRIFDEL